MIRAFYFISMILFQ